MPTSVFRQSLSFLPSARRACAALVAAGLVLGLATTTAGAAPAQVAPVPASTAAGATTESLDPAFIQEGMPSPHGGQVVGWGDTNSGSSPRALPDGVYATAISTDDLALVVLRSDGGVDYHHDDAPLGSPHHVPDPPDGTRYTAVSGDSVLRSDGVVVTLSGRPRMTPPDGLAYTAISGDLSLRSDGVLDPPGDPDWSCADARDPGAALRYTAVSARSGSEDWVALRSDGAFVHCRQEFDETAAAVVVEPPEGTRFVGIDLGQSEAIATTADGRVISSNGGQLTVAPAGRSIVSLAAMRRSQGAAALDDGTIISWGLNSGESAPPVVPAGRQVFSAVTGYFSYGQHWAIMVGDPIPVDVSVETTVPTNPLGPTERPTRVTDRVTLKTSAALEDGTPVPGLVTTTVAAPDGAIRTLEPKRAYQGAAETELYRWNNEVAGTYALSTTFSRSPYVTSVVETTVALAEPSPVTVTTSGPTTWHDTSEESLCFELSTQDGSPLWLPSTDQITITVDGRPDLKYVGGYEKECADSLDLDPGTYTLRYHYEGWGEVDSASWSGQVVVLPAISTRIESDLPSSWQYGEMPDLIDVDVLSDSLAPKGYVYLELDRMPFGDGAQLDTSGHGRISTRDDGELVPGTYPMVLRFRADGDFLDSRLERTVTVRPASFTTATPTITGTAKVGSTLTAVPGTWSPTPTGYRYAWKVDGVAVTGARSSTFTVPESAAGKGITVTVTGLKQYYESSATSAPTAAVTPGTFAAPLPAVTGTAKVGMTLTVNRGTWSPVPSAVQYVWKADGVTIATQATSAFVVPASANGKRLTVTVTGSRAGYTTKSVTSGQTAVIAPGTFTAPRPTISGTTRVGSTLTVSRGTWSPAPSSVNYVWKADGAYLETRRDNRFVIPSRARGKHLTVTVVGSRAGYTTKSVASYRTAAIS